MFCSVISAKIVNLNFINHFSSVSVKKHEKWKNLLTLDLSALVFLLTSICSFASKASKKISASFD